MKAQAQEQEQTLLVDLGQVDHQLESSMVEQARVWKDSRLQTLMVLEE